MKSKISFLSEFCFYLFTLEKFRKIEDVRKIEEHLK